MLCQMALESKNKLGFLDGSVQQPSEDDLKFRRWKKINPYRVMDSEHNSTSLRASITKVKVVKVMWDKMLHRFQAENVPRYY